MEPMSIRKILTLRCREATELMSAAEDGCLSRSARLALRLHLAICGPCRRFRRQLRDVRRMTDALVDRLESGDGVPGVGLSDEARSRLRRAVDEGLGE